MANYLLLYVGWGMPQTEVERSIETQAWLAWFQKMGDAVVDGGNPFAPVAKYIAGDGRVSDVPAGAMASGYSVIKAESLDAAVSLAKECPIFSSGGSITVYETFDAM